MKCPRCGRAPVTCDSCGKRRCSRCRATNGMLIHFTPTGGVYPEAKPPSNEDMKAWLERRGYDGEAFVRGKRLVKR